MITAQAHLHRAADRIHRRNAFQAAASVATALILAGSVIAGYVMLTATLAALPDIIAASAARKAW